MTSKEKAWELYHKYRTLEGKFGEKVLYNYDAKQCALIAVYEIMEELDSIRDVTGSSFALEVIEYYQEVKTEIEKL